MEKRINDKFNENVIAPNTPEGTKAINEEIALFRLSGFAQVLKQMKLDFQVNKQRMINTFQNEEVSKKYLEEKIEANILELWDTKQGIEGMEKEARE
ncbi:MAG TPA: hypothetical protein VGE82_03105 [Nitrososphaera sp.]|jgi:hypothetical protein